MLRRRVEFMALEKEIQTYDRELPSLLDNMGKFVLIHGDDVVDIFVAYEDALKAGYERFKLEPFLVKRIESPETIQYFSRPLQCRT